MQSLERKEKLISLEKGTNKTYFRPFWSLTLCDHLLKSFKQPVLLRQPEGRVMFSQGRLRRRKQNAKVGRADRKLSTLSAEPQATHITYLPPVRDVGDGEAHLLGQPVVLRKRLIQPHPHQGV